MSTSKPEAPPTYAQATGSSTASSHLEVPQARNGIPAEARRSMEDEQRPLPAGWIRQFDPKEQHQYFVDTKATPPRSIWHHPYDDEQYLKTLSSEERERIQESERDNKVHFDTTDDESTPNKKRPTYTSTTSTTSATGSASTTTTTAQKEKGGFGQRLKNKMTGTTHEERVRERREREEQEAQYYQAHQQFRQALYQAQMTGQPQFLGKDRDGKDVYVEPPGGMYGNSYGGRGYGYNPYASGPYADPNARFIRPSVPYGRPYGAGYGGGYGLPIAGGLLGGMMLGGLLF